MCCSLLSNQHLYPHSYRLPKNVLAYSRVHIHRGLGNLVMWEARKACAGDVAVGVCAGEAIDVESIDVESSWI